MIDIHDHARQHDAREAVAGGAPDQEGGDEGIRGISDAGDEADDGIEAEANIRAWKAERGIQQFGEELDQFLVALELRGGRRWRQLYLHFHGARFSGHGEIRV